MKKKNNTHRFNKDAYIATSCDLVEKVDGDKEYLYGKVAKEDEEVTLSDAEALMSCTDKAMQKGMFKGAFATKKISPATQKLFKHQQRCQRYATADTAIQK